MFVTSVVEIQNFAYKQGVKKDRSTRYTIVPAPLGIEPKTSDIPFNVKGAALDLHAVSRGNRGPQLKDARNLHTDLTKSENLSTTISSAARLRSYTSTRILTL